MTRNELRPLRELANAAVAGTRPPMGEAYGELLLKLVGEHTQLQEALTIAEAALADIGDADREPGDDLAWCEKRAAKALPPVREALAAAPWTQKHWTDYERSIAAAEREKHAPLRSAAEQALGWLQAEQSAADEDCGDPACDECNGIIRPRQRIIDALKEALE